MSSGEAIYVAGDVHGYFDDLARVLRASGLLGAHGEWAGGAKTLWFMGDFVDRGPHGIAVIDLVMRLQQEAALAGGSVRSLMGNHEMMFLAAHRFGYRSLPQRMSFREFWEQVAGGRPSDLEQLRPEHVEWILSLPAIALTGNRLLLHADALFYRRYGSTVDEVNHAFRELLRGDDMSAWDRAAELFSERNAFYRRGGARRARELLAAFGGRQLVHGHTPISIMSGRPPAAVVGPYSYADNLCINVDPGFYTGAPGFIALLPPL